MAKPFFHSKQILVVNCWESMEPMILSASPNQVRQSLFDQKTTIELMMQICEDPSQLNVLKILGTVSTTYNTP